MSDDPMVDVTVSAKGPDGQFYAVPVSVTEELYLSLPRNELLEMATRSAEKMLAYQERKKNERRRP